MECDHTALACTELLKRARAAAETVPGQVVVLGIDAEWCVRPTGARPVAVIQLATVEGYTVVFHIKPSERRDGVIPNALKELLENGEVLLVGVTVGHDLTLISNSYDVRGARKADLGQLATRHLGIGVGARSLEDLCAGVLGKRLSKGGVRMSNWEQPLSEEQVAPLCGWGGTAIVIREGRVVVRLTSIRVAAARMLYPNSQGVESTSLKDVSPGDLVLWDVANTRLQTNPPPLPGVDGAREPTTRATTKGATAREATSAGPRPEAPSSNAAGAGAGVGETSQGPGPLVLEDLFHALYRLSELASVTSGAYWAFLAHTRDAFAIPDPVYTQKAKEVWQKLHPTWTEKEVDKDMRMNYSNKVLRFVPRTVPPREVLVPRFKMVVDAFQGVRDAKTGKLFLTDRLKKGIDNLLPHLELGCVSDPDPRDVQLYFWEGRTPDGLDVFRCGRGTSNVENYHIPIRDLLAGYGSSPRMAHTVMLPFNYRRNQRMAAKHRGLDGELSGWYAHWLLDDVQEVTAGWFSSPLYPGWDSTSLYLDTGELTGLVTARTPSGAVAELEALSLSQACGGGGGGGGWGELVGEDESGEGGRKQVWGTEDGLTPSARYFARMQGGRPGERPATPIQTSAEKNKFNREALLYLIPRARLQERQHQQVQVIDWPGFARSWNEDVAELERHMLMGLHEQVAGDDVINRKSPYHLQLFWTQSRKDVNAQRTMAPHASVLRAVRAKLAVTQQPQAAAQEGGDDRDPPVSRRPNLAILSSSRGWPLCSQLGRDRHRAPSLAVCLEQKRKRPAIRSLAVGGGSLAESVKTKKTAMGRA
eukprot:g9090.t2